MLDFCITGFAQHMKKYKSSCTTLSTEGLTWKFYARGSPLFGYKACKQYYSGREPPLFFFCVLFFF